MLHLQAIIFLMLSLVIVFLGSFTDAEKIKDQITHNLHSSNKFQSKQNSRLNNATGILSQIFIQPYIILSIVTVQVMA